MGTSQEGDAGSLLHLLPDECLLSIASKLKDPADLAALSLVSKTWLRLSNHAKEVLDTRAWQRSLQAKLFEQMLARFNNLRTLVWGDHRFTHPALWLPRSYLNRGRGKDYEEEELPVTDLAALIALKAPSLTSLKITTPTIILDPESLNTLLSALPRLTSLSLVGAAHSQLTQDKALAIAGAACPLLRTFSFLAYSHTAFALGATAQSTAEGVETARQFAKDCPGMRSLTLGWMNPVALASSVALLKACTGLEELHLEPRLCKDGDGFLLKALARNCPRLTSLGLDLAMDEQTAEVLAGVIPSFNWPRLKVLRITSEYTEEMIALELEEATWHAFQSRHPLMEECTIPGLMLRDRFMADRVEGRCWQHLWKVNPGWLYMTPRTDFTTILSALERNCPLLSEVTLQIDEGTDLDKRAWDAKTMPSLPSVTSLELNGSDTDYRRFLAKLDLGACFPSLRHLDLSVDCTFKTKVRRRTSFFEGLGQLESLKLRPLGKNVFGEISLHCPGLQKLKVSSCRFHGSSRYFVGDFYSLEKLELFAVELDDTNARMIAKGCPRLSHLVLDRCSGSDGIKRLLADCKKLRQVTIACFECLDDIKPSLVELTRRGCFVVNGVCEDLLSTDMKDT